MSIWKLYPIYCACKRWMGKDRELCDFLEEAQREVEGGKKMREASNNTESYNTGNFNTGDRNTGSWNTGDGNSGDWNTGDFNTGDWNIGDFNVGSRNTGDCNTGNNNTGNWNVGDWNTGDFNTGDRNTGCFCTIVPMLDFFNKPSTWTWEDWLNSQACFILDAIPEARDNRQEWWNNLEDCDKREVKALPNFDSGIFEECTGIKVN